MSSAARQRLIVLLSGIAAPGLGYAIQSRFRPALVYLFLPLLCFLLICWSRLITMQVGFYILCIGILVPWLYAVFTSMRIYRTHSAVIAINKSAMLFSILLFIVWWSTVGMLIFYKEKLLGIDVYHINGISMAPTLHASEYAIVDTWRYKNETPERKDIVLLKLSYSRTSYIKRVVAVPGDTISFNRNSYSLEPTTNSLLDKKISAYDLKNGKVIMAIPENHYFVIGDNITNTQDSRHFGAVKKKEEGVQNSVSAEHHSAICASSLPSK